MTLNPLPARSRKPWPCRSRSGARATRRCLPRSSTTTSIGGSANSSPRCAATMSWVRFRFAERRRARAPRSRRSPVRGHGRHAGILCVRAYPDEVDPPLRAVTRGLDPRVHLLRIKMDCRVKPTAVRHGLCLKECTALILLDSSWLRIIWTGERINAVRHQNIVFHDLLKHIPRAQCDRLVEQYGADGDPRCIKTWAHLIAMLHAQFSGARGLREIEANLQSHASKLYHLGGCTVSKSALSDANALRPFEIFGGLLSVLIASLQAGYRRKIGDCVRLIDSTSVQLSSL